MRYPSHRPSSHRVLRIVGMVILGAICAVGVAILFGAAVQYLWNHLMPALFSLPAITFTQAVGLLILARLFFGRFGGHGGRRGKGRGWMRRRRCGAHDPEAADGSGCSHKPGCGCIPGEADARS